MSDIQIIEVSKDEIEIVEIASVIIQGAGFEKDSEISLLCAVPLSGHRAVTCDQDGKLIYADKDTPEHGHKVLGITTHAAEADAFCRALKYGELTEPSWMWDVDQPVFIGNSGMLTQTPPVTGFCVIVGFPIKPDTLSVRIQTTVYTGD